MEKTCKQCKNSFEVTDGDIKFYKKISPVIGGIKKIIPEPTHCPPCRQQRRLIWRNERQLYRRKSDLSGKPLISVYSPDKDYVTYSSEEWWSDKWDPIEYGQDFDFGPKIRPFFEQFNELLKKVPRYASLNQNCENCDFSPWMVDSKDCYLSAGGKFNEHCYYTKFPIRSEYCIDCTLPDKCRHCYECVDSRESYECFYSVYLDNCSNCWFSSDLISCRNCFGCVGLRQKEYCIFNEQYSKEKYEEIINQYNLSDPDQVAQIKQKVYELKMTVPHRNMRIINSENCSGDIIKNSKNVQYGFNVEDCEDCKYINDNRSIRDCYDLFIGGFGCELCYEGISFLGNTRTYFSSYCWDGCADVMYSDSCIASKNIFGCVGLRHQQYCILNKQYSKEEYEEIVPRIIEHMQKTGEWGEFFPMQLSPFGYNETAANEYFPLTKEEVLKNGWKWCDFENPPPKVEKNIPAKSVPANTQVISDDFLKWAIECERTHKPFKLTSRELTFYRDHNLPIPRIHPLERHIDRLKLQPPRQLWQRKCYKCQDEIKSTYSPDSPEKVYCEKCYLKEVY